MKKILLLSLILTGICRTGFGQSDSTIVHLNNYSYFYGRQYFVLRSDRAQLFIQTDKVDLGSAFTYLLFDAENARQSERKTQAINYNTKNGFQSSALQVVMGGYPFVALGQNSSIKWVYEKGIPKAEIIWWAGGIQVTEKIFALKNKNAFVRSITLAGKKIVGPERITLRLGVPNGTVQHDGNSIIYWGSEGNIALKTTLPANHIQFHQNYLELTNITVRPGSYQTIPTFIITQIPKGSRKQFLTKIKSFKSSPDLIRKTQFFWNQLTSIKTGDALVTKLYNNVRYTLPGYVSKVGIMDAGVFEYGGQWIRDGSNTVIGLLEIGDFKLAHALLSHMLNKMIADNGATMVSSQFEHPDSEELDQMGELWEALKNYYYWTGDASIIKNNAAKLLALTQRPLQPEYLNATGMVHDQREYWERTFTDGYELAYQIFMIRGLRDAAELSPLFGAQKYARHWREISQKMQHAMLTNPRVALVHNNRLIKRRNVDGTIADTVNYKGYKPDSPALTENLKRIEPDASMALPISMNIINPKSSLAINTLNELETLWNSRWSIGGYDRYNTSSQPDQPGPWSFATCFLLNAQQEAGLFKRSRRTLQRLADVQGGQTGAYFEEIPVIRSQEFAAGLIPWSSAEIARFTVRHWLGIHFQNGQMIIKPNFYPGTKVVETNLRYRESHVHIKISGYGKIKKAIVNDKTMWPLKDGSIHLPKSFQGGNVEIVTSHS